MSLREEILNQVHQGNKVGQRNIASSLDISEARVSQLVSDLRDKGWINEEKDGRTKIFDLTQEGKDRLLEYLNEDAPTRQSLNYRDGSNSEVVDFHNFVVKAEIKNKDELQEKFGDDWGDRWAESWMERTDRSFEYNEATQQYSTVVNGFEVRFTNDNVRVVLGDYNGLSVQRVKDRAMVEARSALECVVDASPVELDTRFGTPMFTVNSQHIALVRDVFADLVVECSETDLRDFQVYDEEGRLRLWVDDSDGERHLECGENSRFEEDDLHFIRDEVYRRMILNKDSWRDMMDFIEGFDEFEELEALPDDVSTLKAGVNFLIWREIKESRGGGLDGCLKNSKLSKKQRGCGCEILKTLKYSDRMGEDALREEGGESGSVSSRLQELERKMNQRLDRFSSDSSGEWEKFLEGDGFGSF
jgi:DNA-binding MarR family transcriptional regulator